MLSQPTRRIDASILVSEGSSSRVGIAIKNRQVGQLKDELAYQSNMLQMHSKGQVNQSPASGGTGAPGMAGGVGSAFSPGSRFIRS